MKRYGHLFEDTFSEENIFSAYIEARRGKRSKAACFEFEKSLGLNLKNLRDELHSGTYVLRPYYSFEINDPKPRVIHAPAFRDVIVQHAIYQIIYPIFDKTFIDTSFACRKGKGTHRCADYVQQSMRQHSNDSYNVHLDIRKFFYSIDREILFKQIKRKIKDPRLLEVIHKFIGHSDTLGVPIGNLLSQLFALIYLNPVDHFVKRFLKVTHYARYVDDMILIGLSKEHSIECAVRAEEFIHEHLNLTLSKSSVSKMNRGLNFVGYRTWKSKRFVRRHSLFKFSKALKRENINSLNSLMSHARKTSSFGHYCSRIHQEKPELKDRLPAFIR